MRQLIVSSGVAKSYTNNVLAAGAIDIVKETTDGFTSLLPGETIADSAAVKIIQGTAEGVNIQTPWIKGSDIIGWSGNSYVAQSAQVSTLTFGGSNVSADGQMTIKFTSLDNGSGYRRVKSYTVNVTAGLTPAQVSALFLAAINADLPDWIASAAGNPIVVQGTTFSLSASPTTELANFHTASQNLDGTNGTTLSIAATAPSLGYGSAEVLAQYENQLKGDRGFYNRVRQPNTPNSYIDTAGPTTYDVYTLRVRNSEPGQIRGVDNIREISIARDSTAAAAVISAFEGAINPYVASCPGAFAPVNL